VCGYALGTNTGDPEPIKPMPESPSLPLWTWVLGLLVFAGALILLLRALR